MYIKNMDIYNVIINYDKMFMNSKREGENQ